MTHTPSGRINGSGLRLLCIGLILALLLSFSGCLGEPATTGTSQNLEESAASAPITTTEPLPSATVPPTTQPDEPPVTEPKELVYTLTQEDVDAFYRLLDNCETLAIAGTDMDAIEESSAALEEQYAYLEAQYSIAMILYYSDMANESLTNQHLDCVDICTQANDAYIQMTRLVYQSDSPAKDMLFEGWTDADIAQLLAYDEQIAQLQQRNAEIAVDYRVATEDDIRIPLYIEFVQNNNRIAQIYGYENYYQYSYSLVYSRDYTPAEMEQMRRYAKMYFADVYRTALINFYNSYYSLNTAGQINLSAFLYNDYQTVSTDYIGNYLDVMPGSVKEAVNTMLTADSLFAISPNAMAGAFTTTIGDRSYCFFGPGYANTCTVIHEAGHYYASRYADLNSIPLDLAETHSQGNEWLFICYLDGKMPTEQYQALLDYRLYNDLAMILTCLMVDEFEQRVYSADLTDFTAEDFDAIMDSVSSQYFSANDAMGSLTDMNAYWRMVVVEQPVYYVSYAVSAVAAIDLYTIATEDFDRAVAIYQTLCEEPDEAQGFQGNVTAAGLSGPFQEAFYKKLADIIKNRA